MMSEPTVVLSKEEVAIKVIEKSEQTGCTLLLALEELIDEFGIEVDDIKSFISFPLHVKLEAEAQSLNLLKEKNKTKCLF